MSAIFGNAEDSSPSYEADNARSESADSEVRVWLPVHVLQCRDSLIAPKEGHEADYCGP